MKFLKPFFAVLAIASLFCSQAFAAAGDFDAQSTYLTIPVTSVSTSYATVLSLTTHACNSGTNSYILTATVRYTEAIGTDAGAFVELTNDDTAITGTVTSLPGAQGYVVLRVMVANIAISHVIALKYKVTSTTDSLKVTSATLDVFGLGGTAG